MMAEIGTGYGYFGDQDAAAWLRSLAGSGVAGDCKRGFLRLADEIEALRAEKAALHEALVAGHRLAA